MPSFTCNILSLTLILNIQRIALEAARKSQAEAMQATRVKSIFLVGNIRFTGGVLVTDTLQANMSHELRTPFAYVFLL
jgi:hypothetical protein